MMTPVVMESENKITFSFQEIIVAMLKERGVREGVWELTFGFGLKALKVNDPNGNIMPACLNFVTEISLVRTAEANGLAVDARRIGGIILPEGVTV